MFDNHIVSGRMLFAGIRARRACEAADLARLRAVNARDTESAHRHWRSAKKAERLFWNLTNAYWARRRLEP